MNRSFKYSKPKIIAEIGCNHMGSLELAKELIALAKKAGVGYVKFQKRNNKEHLTDEQYNAPHPFPENSYGETYGAHREYLEFNMDQNRELKLYCDSINIVFSTSVWDVISAREMISLQPLFLKVPSACNNNFELLRILRDEFSGQVQISIGMTTKNEIEEIVNFFEVKGQADSRLLIYSCTSGYPVPFNNVCLLEIARLKNEYESRVKAIGFSGHHLGIAIDNAAYTLGATWVERHFTKDRTWKGTDHAASLEPAGMKKLCRDLVATFEALSYKDSEILEIEQVQRDKLKYRK